MELDFARPGRVLDQVVLTRPMRAGMGDQLSHRVELVIAREDHRLLADGADALVGLDLLFLHFQVHEALQDVEQAVGLQHLVPEVVRLPVVLPRADCRRRGRGHG